MRTIEDQDGKKWTVVIETMYSVGDEFSAPHISVMTLLFQSSRGESMRRKTAERPLDKISDSELLDILSKEDE